MSVSVFCLSMLRQVWPDRVLDWLSEIVLSHSAWRVPHERNAEHSLAVV